MVKLVAVKLVLYRLERVKKIEQNAFRLSTPEDADFTNDVPNSDFWV